ncbi:MAG: glycosyl hydrolase family 28-related protein [Longimicrobiaceae bacterium]
MIRRNALKMGLQSLAAFLPLRAARGASAAAAGMLDVRDFGARGDDRADDSPAIARALDAARKVGEYGEGARGSIVFFPPGIYRVSRPLDCTAGQFNLLGCGPAQSVLRGATRGDGDCVIDFTAAGFSSARGLLIDVVTDGRGNPAARASTVGVLIARGAGGASATAVNLADLMVRLKSDPGANGRNGTVALYNFGGEEANYHNVYLRGDCAVVVTSENARASGGYGLSSPYRPLLQGSASMSALSVTGLSSLIGIAGPALRLYGGAAMQVDAFLGSHAASPPGGEFPGVAAYPFAIHGRGMWTDFRHTGSMEGFEGLLHLDGAQMYGARLYSYMGRSTAVPAIRLSGASSLYGCDLDVTANAAARGVVSYLVDDDGRAPAKQVQGCHIRLRGQRLRLRAPGSVIAGNVIQSEEPLAATRAKLTAPGSLAGNLITAIDGVEANGVALGG